MSEAMKTIEGKFTEIGRDVGKLTDAELLTRCNRLIPERMRAADLSSASRALTAVAAFAVYLTTEIEKRVKP